MLIFRTFNMISLLFLNYFSAHPFSNTLVYYVTTSCKTTEMVRMQDRTSRKALPYTVKEWKRIFGSFFRHDGWCVVPHPLSSFFSPFLRHNLTNLGRVWDIPWVNSTIEFITILFFLHCLLDLFFSTELLFLCKLMSYKLKLRTQWMTTKWRHWTTNDKYCTNVDKFDAVSSDSVQGGGSVF